jgi:hypothetical protein
MAFPPLKEIANMVLFLCSDLAASTTGGAMTNLAAR